MASGLMTPAWRPLGSSTILEQVRGDLADELALGVDEYRRGEAADPEGLDRRAMPPLLGVEQDGKRQIAAVPEGLLGVLGLGVHLGEVFDGAVVKREYLELVVLAGVVFIKVDQLAQLPDAGPAPVAPQWRVRVRCRRPSVRHQAP